VSRFVVACVALVVLGCQRAPEREQHVAPSASRGRGTIAPPVAAPAPRQGMVWIPAGALVAGTPPDSYPRLADEEIPGEQLILSGFYIDVYPYPNEEGAIPLTNVTRDEAEKLCGERGKRLCAELEWERACKGPDNHVYEYGDRYRPEPCQMGDPELLRPTGLRVGCRSDFGVRDLHGGAWEWTRSAFNRGSGKGLGTVRGGNEAAAELVGRCAHAAGRPVGERAAQIGFRCCEGANVAPEVELVALHPRKLEARDKLDRELARRLLEALPDEARADLTGHGAIEPSRMWSWWPMGNDQLLVMSICAGSGRRAACGVAVARVVLGRPIVLAWAEGGSWDPMLDAENDPRTIWLLGGDDPGALRRRVSYVWGKVNVGPRERRLKLPHGRPGGPAPRK
jgi:formylglycine-generating enzyme